MPKAQRYDPLLDEYVDCAPAPVNLAICKPKIDPFTFVWLVFKSPIRDSKRLKQDASCTSAASLFWP